MIAFPSSDVSHRCERCRRGVVASAARLAAAPSHPTPGSGAAFRQALPRRLRAPRLPSPRCPAAGSHRTATLTTESCRAPNMAPQTTDAASLSELVDRLSGGGELAAQIAHRAYLPARPQRLAEPTPPLPEPLLAALAGRGIDALWSHQVEGLAAARAGRDVLLSTPTASGKSLVFQLPVLEAALRREPGKALFLFPLKALGRDQQGKFDELRELAGIATDDARCAIYDGDTPRKQREGIRADPPRVLISNPDMLHFGILGHAASWQPLLADLRWIVLDELHTYRGVFGSHFHHVLQRLLRLCRRAGAEPSLIASSATASNAASFARQLTGRDLLLVEDSGAPREGRHFLLLQPSTSPYTTSLQLLVALVRAGLKTIVFTKARRMTELLHSWLQAKEPELAARVANYRAGFLASERREIERRLHDGELDAVISTSALEMGIDVGGLDACVLVGYPGSMMATWQRSGRVGRQGRESITALVALPDALDQYLLRQPDEFLGRECEPLVTSPRNSAIASRHLACAATELALDTARDRAYLEDHAATVGDMLAAHRLARSHDGSLIHSLDGAPHRGISLRGGGAVYTIVSDASGRAIGTVDGVRALRECHPGAIYLHAGRQFAISELDQQKRRAVATPVHVDYFTTPLTEKHTEILELYDHAHSGPLSAWLGRVRVTERVVGYERKKISSQERLSREALELDPVEFDSVALWFAAPGAIEESLRELGLDFMGALHACEHAAISLFPVLALCDRGDLGGISIPFHPQVGSGAVFLYEGHEGGVGITEAGFERLSELLDRVEELLARCQCADGCPGCVQSPKCGNGNRPLDKPGAVELVRLLRGRSAPRRGPIEPPPLDLSRPVQPPPPRVDREPRGPEHRFHPPPPQGPEARMPDAAGASVDSDSIGGPSRNLFDLGRIGWSPRSPSAASDTATPGSAPAELVARPPRRPLPRVVERTLLFDVETKRSAEEVGGWLHVHRLGVALAVACFMEENRFRVYREDDVGALVDDLRGADLVVGFNSVRFDYRVLSGYTGEDFSRSLPTLDLLEEIEASIGGRVGLSALCEATLGAAKSSDGMQSLAWYREGRFDEIEQYCRRAVELLRDLYLFGRREGFVCYRDGEDRVLQIPVRWP
ncbi:MAG: DUF1998 domain-containing protein [Acidobacteria bacterium]|nr:MAG: DUF1998 domain-containing protein [Acidobacteriota bacterium]